MFLYLGNILLQIIGIVTVKIFCDAIFVSPCNVIRSALERQHRSAEYWNFAIENFYKSFLVELFRNFRHIELSLIVQTLEK